MTLRGSAEYKVSKRTLQNHMDAGTAPSWGRIGRGELRKTIESLNRALRKHRAPIQFRGDGNGTGVCWDAQAVE